MAWMNRDNFKAAVWIFLAQTLHRKSDRGGVVREVVDHPDAIDLATQFLAAGDPLESF